MYVHACICLYVFQKFILVVYHRALPESYLLRIFHVWCCFHVIHVFRVRIHASWIGMVICFLFASGIGTIQVLSLLFCQTCNSVYYFRGSAIIWRLWFESHHQFIFDMWLLVMVCSQKFFSYRYVSVGDIAHIGSHPPHVAAIYRDSNSYFALPIGYDLVSLLSFCC